MMVFALTWIDTLCWGICFWWMHCISSGQNSLLTELHQVAKRIQSLSEAEHELIQEVHPQVSAIKESVQTVAQAVASDEVPAQN